MPFAVSTLCTTRYTPVASEVRLSLRCVSVVVVRRVGRSQRRIAGSSHLSGVA